MLHTNQQAIQGACRITVCFLFSLYHYSLCYHVLSHWYCYSLSAELPKILLYSLHWSWTLTSPIFLHTSYICSWLSIASFIQIQGTALSLRNSTVASSAVSSNYPDCSSTLSPSSPCKDCHGPTVPLISWTLQCWLAFPSIRINILDRVQHSSLVAWRPSSFLGVSCRLCITPE